MKPPNLLSGDPDERIDHETRRDELERLAEKLAVWHEVQCALLSGNEDHYQHQAAADLIRELAERVPPFEVHWHTPRTGPDAGNTTVQVAGHEIYREDAEILIDHDHIDDDTAFEFARAILEACEADHAE
jgi:hypothetical protein